VRLPSNSEDRGRLLLPRPASGGTTRKLAFIRTSSLLRSGTWLSWMQGPGRTTPGPVEAQSVEDGAREVPIQSSLSACLLVVRCPHSAKPPHEHADRPSR
jgi:hypothetical protein